MFCPNCGAQNDDAANVCTKCGFTLKKVSAPKFKGTMLMMNAPPAVPRPGQSPSAPAPQQPAPQQPPPAAPAAAPGPQPGAQPGFAPKPKLKGTMIGVAPPSMGSNTPQGPGPAPGMGAPGGAQAPTAPMGAIPDPNQPPQQPDPGVNPLGGTMVADAHSFPGYNPQQQQPPAGPPPGQDWGQPPGAPPPGPQFGNEPGIGQPPPGFGAPPPQPGFGGEPPGYAPPAPADQQWGAPQPGAMVPGGPPGAMVPQGNYQEQYDDMQPIPGTVGGSNPVVTVLLIVLTCGIYGIYLLVKNKKQQQQ